MKSVDSGLRNHPRGQPKLHGQTCPKRELWHFTAQRIQSDSLKWRAPNTSKGHASSTCLWRKVKMCTSLWTASVGCTGNGLGCENQPLLTSKYHSDIKTVELWRTGFSSLCLSFLIYKIEMEHSWSLGLWLRLVNQTMDKYIQPTRVSNEQWFLLNSTVLTRIKDQRQRRQVQVWILPGGPPRKGWTSPLVPK